MNFDMQPKLKEFLTTLSAHELKQQQEVVTASYSGIDVHQLSFFKLISLTTDEQIPYREAFEYVISTITASDTKFIYLLSRNEQGVHIYIGVKKDQTGYDTLRAAHVGRKLEASFKGYFPGSKLMRLDEQELQQNVFETLQKIKYAGAVTGVPSINSDHENKKNDFQGIDRLVNSMGNENFNLLIIAQPIPKTLVGSLLDDCYSLYDELSVHETNAVQLSENESTAYSETETVGKSTSKTTGKNESGSKTDGSSNETGSKSSKNESFTKSNGKSESETKGDSSSNSHSTSDTKGESRSVTYHYANRKIKEVLEYLDSYLLPKFNYGMNKGMFQTAVYVLGEDLQQYTRLKDNVLSIFQGDQPMFNNLKVEDLQVEHPMQLKEMLTTFSFVEVEDDVQYANALIRGQWLAKQKLLMTTFMSAKELSIIASMPQHEVIGIPIMQGIDFGLNVRKTDEQSNGGIQLGRLLKRGEPSSTVVQLDRKVLNKHMFIAGVTGAGKTTTCQKLLLESNIPFWVIEPAKTEYRNLLHQFNSDELYLFTIGNERNLPFRLNPFELVKGESIISHVDMMKATFTAAYPMEAAMPQILELALYRCYEQYGWSLIDDSNEFTDEPFTEDGRYFPRLTDLVYQLSKVVEEQKFGRELEQNYIGSLISRISNLLVGAKGLILNCSKSVNLEMLLEKNVIFELEDIHAPEDKALIMGLLLARLNEMLKKKYAKNRKFQHITLIEEAHRLLSRVDFGDPPSKKSAVDTFTDMLAEIRKYGESLIIVDQIPNKLAPEIIKNTNSKMIHRLFASDDKEVVGNAMMMDEQQRSYLSNLAVGELILFNEQFYKPVHIKVDQLQLYIPNELSIDRLQKQRAYQQSLFLYSYFVLASLCGTDAQQEKALQRCYKSVKAFKELKRKQLTVAEMEKFHHVLNRTSEECQLTAQHLFLKLGTYHARETGKLALEHFDEENLLISLEFVYDKIKARNVEQLQENEQYYNWVFHS